MKLHVIARTFFLCLSCSSISFVCVNHAIRRDSILVHTSLIVPSFQSSLRNTTIPYQLKHLVSCLKEKALCDYLNMLSRLINRKRIAVVLFLLLRYNCHESSAQPKQGEDVCLFDGKIFQPGESFGELFEVPRYEERTVLLVALVIFYNQSNMALSIER
jgi:hypothetical protein